MATKKKVKKAAKKKPRKPIEIKRAPRPRRLPGLEDSGIGELEDLANDIADIVSNKKNLMADEKSLNVALVAAMKKHGKTSYSHRGVHVDLEVSEKAKVVIKDDNTDDTPAEVGHAPAPVVSADSLAVDSED